MIRFEPDLEQFKARFDAGYRFPTFEHVVDPPGVDESRERDRELAKIRKEKWKIRQRQGQNKK